MASSSSSSSSSSRLLRNVDYRTLIKKLARALAKPSSVKSTSPLHLPGFATLPYELQQIIIQLACLAPSSSSSIPDKDLQSQTSSRYIELDISTTLSLMTVSTTFYDFVVPMLYDHVTLARPSALASFLVVLSARPRLCKYITSLHIGEIDQLPSWWYPLYEHFSSLDLNNGHNPPLLSNNHRSSEVYIRNSLRSKEEVKLLPSWCGPGHEWPLDPPGGSDIRTAAIRQALLVAQRCIDVDLMREDCAYGNETPNLSRCDYIVRIHEVQAAFDLYLRAMRRLEGARSRTLPALHLEGYDTAPRLNLLEAADPECPFIVTRAEILQHIARPRSVTDRFDHPLLVSRSVVTGRQVLSRSRERSDAKTNNLFSSSAHCPSLPTASTLSSCLDLFRRLLDSTPNLTHLSATNFFQLAVCDKPPALCYLSIKPSVPQWDPAKRLSVFPRLKHLRVCSMTLRQDYLEGILTQLPALKLLEWSLPEGITQGNFWSVRDTAGRLAQREKATEAQPQGGEEMSGASTGDYGGGNKNDAGAESANKDPLVIKVKPLPSDLARLLKLAPEAERAAWITGAGLPIQFGCLLSHVKTNGSTVYF